MNLSRRKLLGDLCTAALAPAILRSGIIMPIKPGLVRLPEAESMVLATPQQIADTMARELYLRGTQPIHRWLHVPGINQSHVDFAGTRPTLFDVKTASSLLSYHVKTTGIAPELPRGVAEAAIGRHQGVEVRYIRDYDIYLDRFISRFDVTHS